MVSDKLRPFDAISPYNSSLIRSFTILSFFSSVGLAIYLSIVLWDKTHFFGWVRGLPRPKCPHG
jgi:hypothetical protein